MATTIEELIPQYLRGLPAYVPGRPIDEVERELKIRAIKLASNENPLGPSPKALEAIDHAAGESHRYPDGGSFHLCEKLAALHGVTPQEIFVGLGSSELIDLTARALVRLGRQGVTADGSYAPFSIAILASGAQLVRVPLCDFAFDLAAMARAVNDDTGIVYLANPNNPTGTAFGNGQLREFLSAVPETVLVVLDEAYIHYAERPDMPRSVELYRQWPNLLLLRTFSKVYGLAGLRIGYGVGQAPLIAAMNKLRTPFNVSGIAQAAALAALDDHGHVRRCIETNRAERKRLFAALSELGLRVVPSETNFLFIDIGPEAATISSELLQAGVIVRPLGWMGFPEAIRISVGIAEENDKLLAAMGRALSAQERAS